MRITWRELDRLTNPPDKPSSYSIPDLPEECFRLAVCGEGDWNQTRQLFPENMPDFVDECFQPLRLNKITEADIDKFMKGKPEMSAGDVIRKLPEWLRDLHDAFLP